MRRMTWRAISGRPHTVATDVDRSGAPYVAAIEGAAGLPLYGRAPKVLKCHAEKVQAVSYPAGIPQEYFSARWTKHWL